MEKITTSIEKYLMTAGVTLFAIFVLAGFPSPYFVPKEIFGTIIIGLFLITCLTSAIIKGESKFSIGKFDIAMALVGISFVLSSILRTPNKMEAFFFPGETTFVIIGILFYFLINQLPKKDKNTLFMAVFTSGIVLSIVILFTQVGLFAKIPQLPSFMKDSLFNPAGSGIQAILYILVALVIGITHIFEERETVKKVFFGAASSVLVLVIVLTGINLLPGKPQAPILPTWQDSWSISVDTLKQSPLLGAGPGNYLSAFNLYRPISYNSTNLWQVRFSAASNFYFTLMTEVGLVGFAAIVILLAAIYKSVSIGLKNKNWSILSLAVIVVGFLFMPMTPALFVLFASLLAIYSGSENKSLTVASDRIPTIIVALPILIILFAIAFFGGKAVLAETYYAKSLDALTKNDAQNTYNYMIKAEKLNPYVDRYHASIAQVDMALANSIASRKDLTDSDRNTITQLVQEAIAEGKATVTLNQGRSGNWEVLAQVYRNIMSFAQGADQFAIQTYTQAVALDPINPNLRISLGGVYYALGQYDNSINAFQLATVAKNDLPNAHFNLSAAYAANKDFDKAITEMETVVALVPKDSADYKTATEALAQLKAQKPATADTTSKSLTPPASIEQTNVQPPIELQQNATPPNTTE